jgi:hypothetical protein
MILSFFAVLVGSSLVLPVAEIRQPPTAPPPRAIMTDRSPSAPRTIVTVACRAVDLTGQPGRHDPLMAAHNWRDLELYINDSQKYECRRDEADLSDGEVLKNPHINELHANFAKLDQCARVGVVWAAEWQDKNPGWAVVGVGCPVPITDAEGRVLDWKMPTCPSFLPGTNIRMRCDFDESEI